MITELNNGFIAVEVEKGPIRHCISGDSLCNSRQIIKLPPGSYTFCFLYPEGVSEEWAAKIVESFYPDDRRFPPTFYNYLTKPPMQYFPTALESLRTLMISKGIDNNKNYAICQKITTA